MSRPSRTLDDRSFPAFPGADELLALLRPEVAETLGGLLRPLITLLGGVTAPRSSGREPAGVGDLATRGRYERLLVSEWLLASELPEEFDRRAAMGEHLFLAPERQGPLVPVRTIALFDAGPSQLGRPRIVQLATMIAFAVRARIARIPVVVGCLQREATLVPPDVDAMIALVGARSFEEATPDDVARFGTFTAEDDLWLVGGADLALPRGAKRIALRDDEDSVHVAVARPGTSVVQRTVPVPASPGALLALRDPRRRLAPPSSSGTPADEAADRLGLSIHPTAPFGFPTGGRHLLVRLAGGAIVAHRLRSTLRDPSQLRYRLRAPEGEASLLGEQCRRGLALLTLAGERIVLHMLGKRGGDRGEAFSYEAPPATVFSGPVIPRLLMPRLDATRAIFLDGDGRVWRLPTTGDPSVLAWDVEAIAESSGGFVMAQRLPELSAGRPAALYFTSVSHLPPYGALPNNDGERGPNSWPEEVASGSFVAWGAGDCALCRLNDGSYVIVRDRGPVLPVGDAEGLVCHGFPSWMGATVVASQGNEVLTLQQGGKRARFAQMPGAIVRVITSVEGRYLAAEDEAGHVTVFNESAEPVLELTRARP